MKSDVLKLVLTDHWFEKIKSGQKTHEYRKVTPFWNKRIEGRYLNYVQFQKAYRKNPERMIFEIETISVKSGKHTDLKCNEDVFDIELGRRYL